jgi:arylsulfatase A-like enzyme/Tfp pilus assembly protein PilF
MARSTRIAVLSIAAVSVLGGAAYWAWSVRRGPQHPNLLLITIDTLRADHVGAYGATTGATPSLDALAAAGVRFDQVQTAVPLTGPSHATILTGQYPPSHGVRGNVVFTLGSKYPTLATLLKREGYATGAFVGAYPVAAAFGFNQGFDTFNEEFHEASVGDPGAERRANEVADAALKWLDSHSSGAGTARAQPFFAWLHFYDPHAPYTPPSPYRERFAGHPYDGEIAFADAQIGRVLEWLRASGRDADTIVVVLADHGEGLGDHQELMHAVLVYQSTMRVPLLIKGPGLPAGRAVKGRAGTIDVAPTVMSLLGFEPDKTFAGRDLKSTWGPSGGPEVRLKPDAATTTRPLYGESLFGRLNCHWATLRSAVEDDWKLILGTAPELYNLARDPGEARDLAREEPERVQRMSIDLQRALQRMAPQGDRAQPNAATPEQERKLRSLGYTSGSAGGGPLDDPKLPDPRTHVVIYDRLQAATAAQGPALAAAFTDVQRITREDPDNPFAFGTLAAMAYRYGSLVVAAQAFARALELDPDRPGIRQNYGKLLRELGRFQESERELRIALAQATEDDSRTRVSLAETLLDLKNTGEAEKLVSEALAHEPKDPEALGARGRVLIAEGRIDDAVASLEQASTSTDPDLLIELAATFAAAKRLDRAQAVAAQALRLSPGHPWAMAVLGRVLVLDGQTGVGLEYLQRAFQIGPRRPAVWDALAAGFDAAARPGEAARCRREAQALREAATAAVRS